MGALLHERLALQSPFTGVWTGFGGSTGFPEVSGPLAEHVARDLTILKPRSPSKTKKGTYFEA